MVLLSKTNKATIFLLCNNPLVKDHATMVLLPYPKHNPHPTQHFCATQVLSCAHAVEPTFFTIVYSFSRGFHSIKKTHAIVHKGSCLHFVKVHSFLFYKYHTQYRLCFRNTAFSHINTEPPSISAKFTHSFLTKTAYEFPGHVLPIIQ